MSTVTSSEATHYMRGKMERLDAEIRRCDRTIEGWFDEQYADEIAMLLRDPEDLGPLTDALEKLGWEKFNQATDRVVNAPIDSTHRVAYHFFQHPDRPWRFEIMHMLGGFSPLHAARLAQPMSYAPFLPVHVSFKMATEEAYAAAVFSLANEITDSDGAAFHCAQQCTSTYGRFSYWTSGQANTVPYLKPRVNLRDAGQQA